MSGNIEELDDRFRSEAEGKPTVGDGSAEETDTTTTTATTDTQDTTTQTDTQDSTQSDTATTDDGGLSPGDLSGGGGGGGSDKPTTDDDSGGGTPGVSREFEDTSEFDPNEPREVTRTRETDSGRTVSRTTEFTPNEQDAVISPDRSEPSGTTPENLADETERKARDTAPEQTEQPQQSDIERQNERFFGSGLTEGAREAFRGEVARDAAGFEVEDLRAEQQGDAVVVEPTEAALDERRREVRQEQRAAVDDAQRALSFGDRASAGIALTAEEAADRRAAAEAAVETFQDATRTGPVQRTPAVQAAEAPIITDRDSATGDVTAAAGATAAVQRDRQLDQIERSVESQSFSVTVPDQVPGAGGAELFTVGGQARDVDVRQDRETGEVVVDDQERFGNFPVLGPEQATVDEPAQLAASALLQPVRDVTGQPTTGIFSRAAEGATQAAGDAAVGVREAAIESADPDATVSDPVALAQTALTQPVRDTPPGAFRGVGDAAALPATIPDRLIETSEFAVGGVETLLPGDSVDVAGEFEGDVVDASGGRLAATGQFAAENPARFGTQAATSAVTVGGSIAAAQRLAGPRAGTAVDFGTQPVEAAARVGAGSGVIPSRVATLTPGVRSGQFEGTAQGPTPPASPQALAAETDIRDPVPETLTAETVETGAGTASGTPNQAGFGRVREFLADERAQAQVPRSRETGTERVDDRTRGLSEVQRAALEQREFTEFQDLESRGGIDADPDPIGSETRGGTFRPDRAADPGDVFDFGRGETETETETETQTETVRQVGRSRQSLLPLALGGALGTAAAGQTTRDRQRGGLDTFLTTETDIQAGEAGAVDVTPTLGVDTAGRAATEPAVDTAADTRLALEPLTELRVGAEPAADARRRLGSLGGLRTETGQEPGGRTDLGREIGRGRETRLETTGETTGETTTEVTTERDIPNEPLVPLEPEVPPPPESPPSTPPPPDGDGTDTSAFGRGAPFGGGGLGGDDLQPGWLAETFAAAATAREGLGTQLDARRSPGQDTLEGFASRASEPGGLPTAGFFDDDTSDEIRAVREFFAFGGGG